MTVIQKQEDKEQCASHRPISILNDRIRTTLHILLYHYNSHIWREFCWKNLTFFFVCFKFLPSKQLNRILSCWREYSVIKVDYSHIFRKCDRIIHSGKMI